jgi:hypothetical protein
LAVVFAVAAFGRPMAGQSVQTTDEFAGLHFRSIGPAQASGRIADIAVYEANPAIFYVGSAHGGVWKTTNNGATFTALFQHNGLMSVGDMAVSQKNPDLVWLGSGESNNRQSASWGSGIWKSTDGGTTWALMGLPNSKHINRIVMDPENNDIVLVAATGSLWGPGGERGVYKTTDGGKTWKAVLTVDANTGANDLVMTSDRRVLYASMYQRQRSQCCMNGAGPGSGIYKSTDGGDTWTKLTNGLPTTNMGRVALDAYRASGNIVYAAVQAEGAGGGGGRGAGGGGAGAADPALAAARGGAAGAGAAGAGGAGAGGAAGRGAGRAGGGAGGGGRAGAGGGGAVAANPPAGGAIDTQAPAPPGEGIYRSDDGGASWRRVGTNPDGRAMYFSQLRVDPNNPDRVLIASVRMSMSTDGGRSFAPVDGGSVHDDKHAIWWDPANSNHILIGSDGGAYQTWDMTRSWIWFPNIPVATFYHVGFDMESPYNVCGGMQDNYDWCGPSAVRSANGITNDRWHTVQGGDGFVAIMDARDGRVVYTESQDGNMSRRNRVTGESKSIRPNANNTTDPNPSGNYRFHWDTPLFFSPHDPGVLFAAGNKLFRSTDRGDSWTAVSADLTSSPVRGDQMIMGVKNSDVRVAANDGIVCWPCIVTANESPKQAGVYYAGTDDGVVSVSKDGGKTWDKTLADRMPGFVKGGYVSEVVPSKFDLGTVYVTQDAHRINDFETHIWASNDFGATWRSLNANLKGEVARSITEDPRNGDVLYLATEAGMQISIDRGKSWKKFKGQNFPDVRVDEIVVHPRDNALLIATHGRGIWILDHLEAVQEYATAAAGAADVKLFTPDPALQWRQWDDRNDEFWGHQFWVGENPPTQAVLQLYFKKAMTDVSLRITDAAGKTLRDMAVAGNRAQAGIQTVCWDMRVDPIVAGGTPAADATPNRGGGAGAGGAGAGGGGAAAGGGGAAGGAINPQAGAAGAQPGRGAGGGRGPNIPQPEAGYMAANPCGGGAGGGRGGFGGGGGAPMVLPGNYNVSLVVAGKVVETKPLKITVDSALQNDNGRKRATEMALDLHDVQRRGQQAFDALQSLESQMSEVSEKVKASKAPDAVKAQFDAFVKEFDGTKAKFGVGPAPAPAAAAGGRGGGGGGGGGRGGGAPVDQANVLGRVNTLKTDLSGFGDMVSDAQLKSYTELKAALPKAVTDANAVIIKAMGMSQTLKKYDVTLNAPAPVK